MSDVPKYGEIVNVALIDENRKLHERIAALEHMLERAAEAMRIIASNDEPCNQDCGCSQCTALRWLEEYRG